MCLSYGLCELTAPAVFRVGDDDVVEVLIPGDLPTELEETTMDAALVCPARALQVQSHP